MIAACAQDGAAQPIKAFTVRLDSDSRDESPEASRYARLLGLEHIVKTITANDALTLVEDAVATCGEPFADYSLFPTMLIAGEAAKEVKVILSGDGGDELFWGYGERFGSVIKAAGDFRQPQWLRNLRWFLKKYVNVGDGYYNLRYPSIGSYYLEKHSRMPVKLMNRVFPELKGWPESFEDFTYHGWRRNETAQWLRYNEFTMHLAMVLLKVDRASMHHALEVRVPLLDREVIDAALRFSWQDCLHLDTQKGKLPLRRLLKDKVSFQTLEKKGFEVPMDRWIVTSLYPLLEDTVLSRDNLLGYEINPREIRRLIEAHKLKKINLGSTLWLLLSLALWERKYY
jgi:asparagine synthase (glutamine-hydrolysing)